MTPVGTATSAAGRENSNTGSCSGFVAGMPGAPSFHKGIGSGAAPKPFEVATRRHEMTQKLETIRNT
jgi:hypothetical protein